MYLCPAVLKKALNANMLESDLLQTNSHFPNVCWRRKAALKYHKSNGLGHVLLYKMAWKKVAYKYGREH